jgi:hypothetical protein
LHEVPGSGLIAYLLHYRRPRTNESDAAVGADLGKVRVLGKEAIARMDGVRARLESRPDDARNVKVAPTRLRRTDVHRFIREAYNGRLCIGRGIDGDRLDP